MMIYMNSGAKGPLTAGPDLQWPSPGQVMCLRRPSGTKRFWSVTDSRHSFSRHFYYIFTFSVAKNKFQNRKQTVPGVTGKKQSNTIFSYFFWKNPIMDACLVPLFVFAEVFFWLFFSSSLLLPAAWSFAVEHLVGACLTGASSSASEYDSLS